MQIVLTTQLIEGLFVLSFAILLKVSYSQSMATFEKFIEQGSPAQSKEKKIGSYLIEKTLGKGTFGKVKLATHIPTGEKVAIKILEKDRIVDVADVERVSREIHILKLIRHPNIIQLYEIIQTPKHLFLVMEYMERGELFDYIVGKKRMEEEQACKVFEQIVSGIEYIHKLRIVHRDLKLENCLIDFDKTIRIVDFGLSNTYKPEERLRTACGSPCYAAPQMIEGKAPYEPLMVDIWSAGVILFAMVCGFLPFEDKDTPKLYRKILNGEYNISSHVSIELQDFISKVLTVDPTKRIRAQEMKKHVWWRKYSDNYYPEGLIVGYHKIPIEPSILKEIKNLGLDPDLAQKSLETNMHNNMTTTYYLLYRKHFRQGDIQKVQGKSFDKLVLQHNQRRSKNNLKPSDLLKMITTPVEKQRAKSYYLGPHEGRYNEDNKSLGNHSVRIDQKKRSSSKNKRKDKNKSLERDSTNNSHLFKMSNKQIKRDKSINKSINKSQSKHAKSPQKIQYPEEENYRPRAHSQKNKVGLMKKSHQGSYMIGAQPGIDWPLEPKWKGETGGKIKNGMRRR